MLVDDVTDLVGAAEEDGAGVVDGDAGEVGNGHCVVFDEKDAQGEVGVDAGAEDLVGVDEVGDDVGGVSAGGALGERSGPGGLIGNVVGEFALVEDCRLFNPDSFDAKYLG